LHREWVDNVVGCCRASLSARTEPRSIGLQWIQDAWW